MFRQSFLIVILVFSIMLQSLPVHASECDEIIQAGVFDFKMLSKEDDFVSEYINWLKANNFRSDTIAQGASAQFGITLPVEGIPLNLGFGTRDSNQTSCE